MLKCNQTEFKKNSAIQKIDYYVNNLFILTTKKLVCEKYNEFYYKTILIIFLLSLAITHQYLSCSPS